MTFEEWFLSSPHRAKYDSASPSYLAAREAWKAATKIEREACATLADSHGCDTGNLECQGCGEDIAADIRARSNLKDQGPPNGGPAGS